MAYRVPPGPSPHPNLEPPPPDAAWYEQLAHQVLLAHQPAPARAKRETAPPSDLGKVVALAAKHFRPRCLRCGRDAERVAAFESAAEPSVVVHALCHGENAEFTISVRAMQIASASGHGHLADLLRKELCRDVFAAPAKRYERFEDPRDGYADGFEPATVRSRSVPTLVAAVMVKIVETEE